MKIFFESVLLFVIMAVVIAAGEELKRWLDRLNERQQKSNDNNNSKTLQQ